MQDKENIFWNYIR